jgi:hypothetical protein
MAYPDYSIVIVSVTTNGVTTDFAQSFFNDELAKKYYQQAVSEGKRAFYYEKPKPTNFARNDAQPIVANTEKGKENLPLAAGSTTEQKIAEVAETIRGWTAPIMIANAFGVQQQVDSAMFTAGEKLYGVWKGFNNMLRRALIGTTYTQYGQILFQVTVTNKRITFRADGNGEFIVPPEIEKLWPDKDEITWTPPLTSPSTEVIVTIEGQSVNIGTKRGKKTHDGTQNGGVESEEYIWVPAGFTILDTETHTYHSNGSGWYTATEKSHTNCDPAGTVLSTEFIQDLMYPIVKETGLEEYVQIGYQYRKDIANGDCSSNLVIQDQWLGDGSIVYQNETTWWKSNGSGGVYIQPKPNDGDGGDDGDGGNPDCPSAGIILETIGEPLLPVTEYFEGAGFVYVQGETLTDRISDGTCGYNTSEPRIEYNEEGLFLGYHNASGVDYTVSAGANGSAIFEAQGNVNSDENTDGLLQPDSDTPDLQFPQGSDCVDPIPAGYPPDLISTSCFKSVNGAMIGTQSRRTVVVTLPQGYYVSSIMGLGGAMPSNTFTLTTGNIWTGRFISDGNCGWTPEDDSPTNDKRWTFPATTSFPAGFYSNLATVATSGSGGTWFVSQDMGPKPRGVGNERIFKTARVGFRHDGKGNVTVVFR